MINKVKKKHSFIKIYLQKLENTFDRFIYEPEANGGYDKTKEQSTPKG